MTQFSVSTVFTAINHMTAPIRQMQASVKQFTSQIQTSNQQVNKLGNNSSLTKLQVHFRNLRGLVKDAGSAIGQLGSKLAKLATPGFGSIAALTAGGYAAKQMLDNSSNKELQEKQIIGTLQSNPRYKTIKDKEGWAFDAISMAQKFGAEQVGEDDDWITFLKKRLGYGMLPNTRTYMGAANLAAMHPEQMAGFNEMYSSIHRGNPAEADAIPGLKATLDVKGHKGEMIFNIDGKNWNAGKPTDKGFHEKVDNILTDISEKYFGTLHELMASTFAAKEGSLIGTTKNLFDAVMRKTQWWEKFVKPAMERLTKFIETLTPKLTGTFEALYKKLNDTKLTSSIGDLFEKGFNKLLDKITVAIEGLDSKKIEAFGTWLASLPEKFDSVIPKIKEFTNAISKIAEVLVKVANMIPGIDITGTPEQEAQKKVQKEYENSYSYTNDATLGGRVNNSIKSLFAGGNDKEAITKEWQSTQQKQVENKQQPPATINQTFTSTAPIQAITTTSGTGPKPVINNTGNNSQRAQRTGFMGKY